MNYTAPASVIEYVAPAYAVCAATARVNEYRHPHVSSAVEDVDHEALWVALTNMVRRSGAHTPNCSVTDCDGEQSEHDAVPSYLSELEVQCIATPETHAGWKVRREDDISGLTQALFLLNEGDVFLAMARHRIPSLTDLMLHLR